MANQEKKMHKQKRKKKKKKNQKTEKKTRESETKEQTRCLISDQSSNDSKGATTPSGRENLGAFSLIVFGINTSPNFL